MAEHYFKRGLYQVSTALIQHCQTHDEAFKKRTRTAAAEQRLFPLIPFQHLGPILPNILYTV